MTTASLTKEDQSYYPVHPKKFILWLFLGTVVMLFAAFTSAYIVRRTEGDWEIFNLPSEFMWSTGIVILGSILMQLAYQAAKSDKFALLKFALWGTLAAGVAFLFSQIQAWSTMIEQGIYYVGNASGSFVYVISAAHAIHLVASLVFLIVILVNAHRYQIHSKSLLRINLCTTLWHFLGGLWIYLFIFLSTFR